MSTNQEQHEDLKRGQYRPTIFIGCGGTGAKILQRIRLQALERFGGFSQTELPGVAFISIDTDQAGAKAGAQDSTGAAGEKERTKALCNFIPDERLNLDPGKLKNITESASTLAQHPHIKRWFEPKMLTITQRTDASTGAGQMRPLARVVAVTNYDTIIGKIDQANGQVKKYDLTGDRAKRVNQKLPVQVVIVAGLAGGTGAGIFLEVAAMVRDRVPEANIQGRFVLPGVFRKVDSGAKLPANGYACLKEINHYFQHPYPAQWAAGGQVLPIARIYDDVYVFDNINLTQKVAGEPDELYTTIGDTLFLNFFQGNFADDRVSTLVNRHPVLMKMWKNVPQLSGDKWKVHGDTGGASEVDRIALEQFPRKFNSSGISRLCTPAWRMLNQLSYRLAEDLLDCLDGREDLLSDEAALKRDFAHRLGFYQGEVVLDGMKKRQYAVVDALGVFASEGNDRARLSEAIRSRFEDLTLEDQVQIFWVEKNCRQELGRRWDEVGDSFAGLRNGRHPGVYTKGIKDNWRTLYNDVKGGLQEAIEHFCEQPYMGPWRIKEVMERLAKDIRVADVFWIKEMEKRAVEAGARAEEYRSDWDRWSKLAAEADTASMIFRRRPAFQTQLQNAQEAAVNYWNAVAEEYIYEQAADLLNQLAKVLDEEVARQNDMVERLSTMRIDFGAFAKEYSRSGTTAVQVELPLPGDWVDKTLDYYLGDTDARRKETLYALFERSKREMGIPTNLALRERLVQSKDGFARDLRQCCWMALHGTDGRTDWFGEEDLKLGLIVKAGFWEQLKVECGSDRSPRLKELATTLLEQSMPWASLDHNVAYDEKLPLDVYLVLPKSEKEHVEYVKAFKAAVSESFRSIPQSGGQQVSFSDGSEHSEAVCFSELFAMIPASLKSMHGSSGMAAQFQRSSDKAKDNDPEGFLHTDLDTVQFDDLMPTGPQQADAVFDAWKLFLLGTMLRVVKSAPNTLKPRENEAQRLAPVFSFSYRGRGVNVSQPLGQYQSAVAVIRRDANVRAQLQDMVNAEFISQSAIRYEKLLGLAKYYKQCIFPIRKPRADTKDLPVASPPYVALTKIENECLTSWQDAVKSGSPSGYDSLAALVKQGPQKLLWTLREFAGHAGGSNDKGAALKLGMPTTNEEGKFNYLEEPPGKNQFDTETGPDKAAQRLDSLKHEVFELLPPDLARNGALREQNRYFPWLALAEWHEVFLPSRFGATPPDRKVKSAVRRKKIHEMSAREIVKHFEATPDDGALKRGGAQLWLQDPSASSGDWVYWSDHPRVKAAVDEAGLELPETASPTASLGGGSSSGSGATPPAPAAAATPPAPSAPSGEMLDYVTAGGTAEKLTAADVAARMTGAPGVQHYVLVNGAWADANTVPAVQQRLALPPVPGGPGLPPPPPPLPASPPAVVPIPEGPFTFFVQGVHTNWVQVSGADLVEQALAQPAGQEGHIHLDGLNVVVMDHPGLGAAIKARRS